MQNMDELTDIWDDNQRQKTMDHVLQGIDGRTKEWMYNECIHVTKILTVLALVH